MKYVSPEMVKMVIATADVITSSKGEDIWLPEV